MATGNAVNYSLFHPTKRAANKAIAVEQAAKLFEGEVVDKSTIETKDWGKCHVAAYTDQIGAMIATAESGGKFGDVDWQEKETMVMVREQPRVRGTPPKVTFYVCKTKDLFEIKSVGYAGVKWIDVAKAKLFSHTVYSEDLVGEG